MCGTNLRKKRSKATIPWKVGCIFTLALINMALYQYMSLVRYTNMNTDTNNGAIVDASAYLVVGNANEAIPSGNELACCEPSHERCDWVKKVPYTIPECEKQNLLSLLQWLNTVLHDVSWWITAGTLLGAVREEGHIPHETDIDVSILTTDWPKAVSQIHDQLNKTHFHFDSNSDPPHLFFSKQNTIHIDFWKVQRQNNSIFEPIGVHGKKFEIDARFIYPLSTCMYNKVIYPCPRFPKLWVEHRYGKEWYISKPKYSPNATYKDGDGFIGFEVAHRCPPPESDSLKWQTFTDMVNVLNDLNCPYNLHGGTLLNFVRDCELKDSDFDFAISLEWWRENFDLLDKAVRNAGFVPEREEGAYGTIGKPGYEMPWEKRGFKVDFFSRIDEQHRYVTPLWEGRYYNCTSIREEYSTGLWGDIVVRVPVPFEDTLVSLYGKDWKLPFPGKWRWFEDAFEIGSCQK